MRIAVCRRLGLPIVEAAAVEGLRSKHGKMFDRYGDVASNDGDGGHQTRHYKLNLRIADVLRSVWGSAVQREPEDHASYSDYRPDLVALGCGRSTPNTLRIIETKLLSSIPSDPSMMSDRGRTVGFANTLLEVNEQVRGLQERGSPKDGQWRYATGTGYVKAKSGDYTRALEVGCDLTLLCFETLGGFSAEVVELLHELARERDNKLTPAEYEETTWSARSWTTFAAQKISVALHYAAAFEISMALRVPKFDQAELDAAAARRRAGGG